MPFGKEVLLKFVCVSWKRHFHTPPRTLRNLPHCNPGVSLLPLLSSTRTSRPNGPCDLLRLLPRWDCERLPRSRRGLAQMLVRRARSSRKKNYASSFSTRTLCPAQLPAPPRSLLSCPPPADCAPWLAKSTVDVTLSSWKKEGAVPCRG